MRILPILSSINTDNYNSDRLNYNNIDYRKNVYVDTVSFSGGSNIAVKAAEASAKTVEQVDLEAILADSGKFIKKLGALLTREKELRTKADAAFQTASISIGQILEINGFKEIDLRGNRYKSASVARFKELFKQFGGKTLEMNEARPSNSFMNWTKAQFNPDVAQAYFNEPYSNKTYILTLKIPDSYDKIAANRELINDFNAQLEFYMRPLVDSDSGKPIIGEYKFGIYSYKDSKIELQNAEDPKNINPLNYLRLVDPEIDTLGLLADRWYFDQWLVSRPSSDILDKQNKATFVYDYGSRLRKIYLRDENITYNLQQHVRTIEQLFPNKNMCVRYSLPGDLKGIDNIIFSPT